MLALATAASLPVSACSGLPGVSAVVSLLDCAASVQLTSHLGWLPHVVVSTGQCMSGGGSTNSPGAFFLAPPLDWHSRLVASIVLQEKWDSLTVLYDHSIDEGAVSKLMMSLTRHVIKVRAVRIEGSVPEGGAVIPILSRAVLNKERRFAVLVELPFVQQVLHHAVALQLNTIEYYWIVVNDQLTKDTLTMYNMNAFKKSNMAIAIKNNRNFEKFSCTKARDHLTDKIPSHTKSQEVSVLDAILLLADAFHHFENEPRIQSELSMLHLCGNETRRSWSTEAAKRVVAHLENNTDDVAINDVRFDERHYNQNATYDVYCIVEDGDTVKTIATARWSHPLGLELYDNEVFVNQAMRLRSSVLNITTKVAPPYVVLEEDKGKGGPRYNGVFFEVLEELSKRLGFKYQVIPPVDGVYGAPQKNKSWNGMIGMLMRGEVEIVIAPMTVTSERLSVVDFCEPIIDDGIGIIMRRPNSDAGKVFRIFKPFEPAVWVTVVLCILLTGGVLHFINHSMADLVPEGKQRVTWQESLWAVYAHYIEQSNDLMPESNSGRGLMIFWWLFVIIVSAFYTANLVAFLTVSIESKPIDNLADLAKPSATLKPLIKDGSNLVTLFRDSKPDTTYRKIWDIIDNQIQSGLALPTDNQMAYDMLLTGDPYAFLLDSKQLQYHMMQQCGQFVMADTTFNTAGLAFAFRKGSRLVEKFSHNIVRLRETGLIERWQGRWWSSSSGECSTPKGPTSTAEPLDVLSIASVFVVLSVAVVLGFFSLMAERFMYMSFKKTHSRPSIVTKT